MRHNHHLIKNESLSGFYLIQKRLRVSVIADAVGVYWENGYTQWKDFPKEYFFMFNPVTLERVRLYYRTSKVVEGEPTQ